MEFPDFRGRGRSILSDPPSRPDETGTAMFNCFLRIVEIIEILPSRQSLAEIGVKQNYYMPNASTGLRNKSSLHGHFQDARYGT